MALVRRVSAGLAALVLLGTACSSDDRASAPSSTSPVTTTVAEGSDGIDLGGCPPETDDAGVTPPRSSLPGVIRVTTSHPTAGVWAGAAGTSHGAQARFAAENESGGVEVAGSRYLIEVSARNDAGDPVATRANVVDELAPDKDPAFAAFGLVGTDNVLAVRDQLTRWCVPDIFPVSTSAAVSAKGAWSVGAPVVLESTEVAALVGHLASVRPEARMALLLPAGTRGDRLEAAFTLATTGTTVRVVAMVRVPVAVDTDVSEEVAALAASGADVFIDAAELLSCPAALAAADQLGWPEVVAVVGGCASRPLLERAGPAADGVLMATNLMDPASEPWASSRRVEEYREAVASWAGDNPEVDVDPDDPAVALGWTMADLFIGALSASTGVSRSEVMASLTTITASEVGLILEDVVLATGPGDRWLGESAQIVRFDADDGTFEAVGEVRSFEGGAAVPEELRPDS